MALNEGLLNRNPAKLLYTPRDAPRGIRRVMNKEEINKCLQVLELRERLIARLAIFAGMRPGEIFGLMWKHIDGDKAEVSQRLYRGQLGSPKSRKSFRLAAISPAAVADLKDWRSLALDLKPDAWVFPSERRNTPLSKDNCWRRHFKLRLQKIGLEWANFQVMRRTYCTSSHKGGIDPKIVADQVGHGLGVNLDVYTQTDHAQRAEAVRQLEREILQ